MVDELDKILPLLSLAEQGRNRVVHATWIGSSGGNAVFFHKPKVTRSAGLKDGGIRHATTADIEAVSKIIDDAINAVCELGRGLGERKVIRTNFFVDAVPKEQSLSANDENVERLAKARQNAEPEQSCASWHFVRQIGTVSISRASSKLRHLAHCFALIVAFCRAVAFAEGPDRNRPELTTGVQPDVERRL